MGIEQFFSSLESSNINIKNKFTYKSVSPLITKKLFIDFNSIVYVTSNAVINDLNYFIYNIIYKKPIDEKIKQIIIDYKVKDLNDTKKINIDEIVLIKIREYIKYILTQLVDANSIEFIYIAIDGVPNKNKMIEQRKRRYMAAIINEYKKQLFDKYVDEFDNNRYAYETNKLHWSKNNITPGTEFMYELNLMLQGSFFEVELKNICPNLNQYIYNGPYIFGEGEKKIMDYIYSHIISNDMNEFVIYSPDSDMTILALILLSHHKCSLKLLRHNQQQNDYDIIDINVLSKNIISYIQTISKLSEFNEIDSIRDLSFIMTIFGNDYIPKIETFDVKFDFSLMVNAYVSVILREKQHIIYKNVHTNKYVLNDEILKEVFIELAKSEESHLYRKYMVSNYTNYYTVKQQLGATDENFLEKLVLKFNQPNDINFKKNELSLDNEKYYEKFKKQTFTTIYDREVFRLDNMLDEYTKYFHAGLTDIGKVAITHNKLFIEPLNTVIKKYYDKKFPTSSRIKTIVHKYIEGLVWVFNYYYNGYDANSPNLWYYEYDHAPLLKSIVKYFIGSEKFTQYDYDTNFKLYFNPFEHFIYVSPMRLISLPSYIKKFAKFTPNIGTNIKKEILSGKLINCDNAIYLTKCHVTIFARESWIDSHKNDIKFLGNLRKVKFDHNISKLIGDSSDNKIFIANYSDIVPLSLL